MDIWEWQEKYTKLAHIYKVSGIDCKEVAESIINDLREALASEKILLWGAGVVGRNLLVLFDELSIEVACVIDKNAKSLGNLKDREVCLPEKLKEIEDVSDWLIIVSTDRKVYPEIMEEIKELVPGMDRILSGHDLHMVAQNAFCTCKAEGDGTICLKDCYECTNLDNQCKPLNAYLKRLNGFQDQGRGSKEVVMIGYVLGNICTLRCKNCCESIPYFEQKDRYFTPLENIKKDIEKLSRACNFLTHIEFVGGEPFLHKDLPEVLRFCKEIKNIGSIHVFTNGTVVPGDELCEELKSPNVLVYLSNYQAALENQYIEKIEQTSQKLEENGIQYLFGKRQSWLDFREFELVNEDDELEQVFEECFIHNCNRLHDGVLYVCAHQYAGIRQKKLKDVGDSIHIHEYDDKELIAKIDQMRSWKFIDACRYCTMPHKAKTVLSGEQLT